MNWQSRPTDKVVTKTVGKFTLIGWIKIYPDNNRCSAVVFVQEDAPVESRQQTFYDVDEAVVWVEEVIGEIAKEASWSSL